MPFPSLESVEPAQLQIPIPSALQAVAIALLVLLTSFAAIASLPQPPALDGEPVAIVFAPWTSAREAAARSFEAGHLVLRGGRAPFIVVASAPVAAGDVHRPAGAMLMLRLSGLAGCLDALTAEEARQ